jgi:hypothetical protein
MMNSTFRQAVTSLLILTAGSAIIAPAQQTAPKPFPYREKLEYRIEWRLITAGTATVDIAPVSGTTWQTKLNIESAGMVSRLYRVSDSYRAITTDKFCGINANLDAQEGKRHRLSTLIFDNSKHKLQYEDHDLVSNKATSKIVDIPPCTHEISGALASLRLTRLEPGKTLMLPITDGKKTVLARVQAEDRETITIDQHTYHTIRYEAFLFDNVLYRRKGQLWVWMTDDASHVPVQIRVRLGFPIGNILLSLVKDEHS